MSLSQHRGRWFVVKIGGELVLPGKLAAVAQGLGAFLEAGIKVAIVHGGGPQATALTQRLGLTPTQIAGRRVTDEPILQVMKQALAGEVNVDLTAQLRAEGLRVVGLHGVSAGLVDAVRRPPRLIKGGPAEPVDLGLVGDVVGIDTGLLEALAAASYVPAIASIAGDSSGNVYNINADTIATKVAAALHAAKLLLVAGVPGVLADPKDPSTRIPRLDPEEVERLIESGIISGGMIPKVQDALGGIASGIDAVHICGAGPGELLAEASEPGSSGTVFRAA